MYKLLPATKLLYRECAQAQGGVETKGEKVSKASSIAWLTGRRGTRAQQYTFLPSGYRVFVATVPTLLGARRIASKRFDVPSRSIFKKRSAARSFLPYVSHSQDSELRYTSARSSRHYKPERSAHFSCTGLLVNPGAGADTQY